MSIPLSQLDGAPVLVEIDRPGGMVSFRGTGRYERSTDGNRLLIDAHDPADMLTLVIDETQWTGEITQDPDSTYRIRLSVT